MSLDESEIKDKVNELKFRLKQHINPEMYEDDALFRRFLKVKNFDVDQAENMLKEHLEWRQKYDVDNISKWKQPEVLEKYVPFIFLGYDKEGCIVRYLPAGSIDWIGMCLSAKTEDIQKRAIQDLEEDIQRMKNQNKRLGKSGVKCIYIYNFENSTFAQATDKKGMLKNAYAINVNVYFNFIFTVVKQCVPSSIIKKIKVFNDDSWKESLLEVIDADVLPAFLGGTRTDPDGNPLCRTFVNQGGPIPESYYIHKSKRSLASCSDVQKLTLSNAAFHEVKLDVKEPGSYLEWEFETKSRDIGFGLFLQQNTDGEEENIEIIPIQRINTDEYAETGLYLCEKEGSYVAVFDNTYSWVRSKELFYRIKIVSPHEQGY